MITVLGFILPGIATKRSQGTKYGFWGGIIGLLAGFVTPIPGGAIAGAFLGDCWKVTYIYWDCYLLYNPRNIA